MPKPTSLQWKLHPINYPDHPPGMPPLVPIESEFRKNSLRGNALHNNRFNGDNNRGRGGRYYYNHYQRNQNNCQRNQNNNHRNYNNNQRNNTNGKKYNQNPRSRQNGKIPYRK